MVRISLSILAGENEDTSLNGRRFALRALEKYSEVDIPESEFEQWAAAGTIPEIPLSIWSMESQIGDSYAGWVALDRAVADKVEAISQMEALQQALVERGLSAAEAEQFAREFFGVPKPTPAGDPDPAEASSAQGPD